MAAQVTSRSHLLVPKHTSCEHCSSRLSLNGSHNDDMLIAGVYNETVFRTVDAILDSASRAGLRVIVAMIDNWQELDGVPSYLNVSRTP